MRVAILSKALVVGAYQSKLEAIAALGVELTALVPPGWREPRVGMLPLERRYTQGYTLEVLPMVLNGQHHIHFYRGLRRALERIRPDVFHIDEESFNLATFQAMWHGTALGARCCFYNYANIERTYPPPFNLFERYNFRHAAHAMACNQEAATIIRRHGYTGPLTIVPQFGVDPTLFTPAPVRLRQDRFVVGYLGRLVPEKGIADLVDALARLPSTIHLRLIGDGVQRRAIEQQIAAHQLGARVELLPGVNSTAVPTALHGLDALVLPSRTMPNWKEQFGRVLIEAMSCGVPVIGSSSGEIPHVIGDAGLVFPEGDVAALAAAIQRLATTPAHYADLRQRGLQRVREQFTQAAIARRHVAIYTAMHQPQ
jgi:glycosyltransferase involved in cell wall biosynthesis